jgi:hypothetical protein
MTAYYKYPKTWHLKNSRPDPKGNDRAHSNYDHFIGKEVVITEKLDGESTSLYCDKIHARSIDSGHHPSRAWVKALHASIKSRIQPNYRICGENLQAKHSILYEALPSYFFVFGVYDDKNFCLSWDDTMKYAAELGLCVVPVLFRGIWDQEKAHQCYTGKSVFGNSSQEGYVVRVADKFHYDDFAISTSKFVKPSFVPGDTEHWSKSTYTPNKLAH